MAKPTKAERLRRRARRKFGREQWPTENGQAIADYNAFVAKHGVFGDDWRLF
jgi:post-segregation antitoxin (ccd killing protein)